MNLSAKRLIVVACLATGLIAATATNAQSAYRCDNNGQTVYSDKPCPAGKSVVGTQDSAEQKAASKDANAQMRQDNADLNKRLSERQKLEALERAALRKQATAQKSRKKVAKRDGAGKKTTIKVKTTKKLKAKAAPKTKKQDNRVFSKPK